MTRLKAAAVVLTFALATTITAPPAFAMQREGPGGDNPVVRVIKQLLHKFGVLPNEDIAVPHP